jgi:hypothetical protein
MEMLCPECLGTLVSSDGQSARCTVHGGEYKILFQRNRPPVITKPPAMMTSAAAGMCVNHPDLRAAFLCAACGAEICSLCGFSRTDGSRVCPRCASTPPEAALGQPKVTGVADFPPVNVHALTCLQHPEVAAVHVCKACGAPMCATCEFILPGDLHVCPRCVANPQKKLSGGRKKMLIGAYILAGWNTIGLATVMSGAFAGMLRTKEDQAVFGVFFSIFLFIPSMIGGALGISSLDRRLSNPASVWIAAIWNGLLVLIHVVLLIIGHLTS